MEYLINVRYHKNIIPTCYQVFAMQRYSETLAKSTAYAPDANLAAADNTSSYYAFERKFLGVVMNLQPGMMYWNGGDQSINNSPDWSESSMCKKIIHTMNSIREFNISGIRILSMNDIFINFPNGDVTNSLSALGSITIGNNEMTVMMNIGNYQDLKIDLYSYDAWNRLDDLPSGVFRGIKKPAGSYDCIYYNSPNQENFVLKFDVQVKAGTDNTKVFENYIFGK